MYAIEAKAQIVEHVVVSRLQCEGALKACHCLCAPIQLQQRAAKIIVTFARKGVDLNGIREESYRLIMSLLIVTKDPYELKQRCEARVRGQHASRERFCLAVFAPLKHGESLVQRVLRRQRRLFRHTTFPDRPPFSVQSYRADQGVVRASRQTAQG